MKETVKDRLICALEGGAPRPIPFVSYSDFYPPVARPGNGDTEPEWEHMFELGFGLWHYIYPLRTRCPEVERKVEKEEHNGRVLETETLRTPLGTLRQIRLDGWTQEYFLKTPADYRVAEYITRHSTVEVQPALYHDAVAWLGERGLPVVDIGRSPYQAVLVEWAGLENFSYHLADGFPEFHALLEAMEDLTLIKALAAAQLPACYISLCENLTADQVGPRRFARIHMPFYEKLLGILHGQGKKVYAHLDGKLQSLAALVAQTGFDGIDSLTEPPEGDLRIANARAAFVEKCLWVNINVSLYSLPLDELRQSVRRMVQEGAPDGRGLIFQVSEDLPASWRQSIPVVLEELER